MLCPILYGVKFENLAQYNGYPKIVLPNFYLPKRSAKYKKKSQLTSFNGKGPMLLIQSMQFDFTTGVVYTLNKYIYVDIQRLLTHTVVATALNS